MPTKSWFSFQDQTTLHDSVSCSLRVRSPPLRFTYILFHICFPTCLFVVFIVLVVTSILACSSSLRTYCRRNLRKIHTTRSRILAEENATIAHFSLVSEFPILLLSLACSSVTSILAHHCEYTAGEIWAKYDYRAFQLGLRIPHTYFVTRLLFSAMEGADQPAWRAPIWRIRSQFPG